MAKVLLKVLLPKNRNRSGTLSVEIDGFPAATFEVLGRGSRGAGNTEFLENGSTPTGVYQGAAWRSTGSQSASSYGPNGKLTLNPVSGNALAASRYFKRVDLLVHGGDLDTRPGSPWNGHLKPTHGCLRIDNEDVTTLHSLLLGASNDESMKMSVAPQVWINVQEGDVFDDSDDGLNQCSAAPYTLFGAPAGVQFQRKP
jgi:hypothetical protein